MALDNSSKDFFHKRLRIALLGESPLMSQNKVIQLCEKFFNYGIEYEKKLNADS